jgi:hypothetical protein
MNDGANYSGAGALLATDDLVFDGTSVINATATAGLSVQSVSIVAAYTGAWSISGQTLTVALGFSDDGGGGTRNYGNGITANGASSTVHFGSTLGAVTATSCVLTMNGTTAMVLDDDKGITFKSLTLGVAAVVTSSGGAQSTLSFGTGAPLTIGANATFTVNRALYVITTGGNDIHNIGIGATFNGTAQIDWQLNGGAIGANVPAITYTGSGTQVFRVSSSGTQGFTFTGHQNYGTATVRFRGNQSGAVTLTFNLSTYNLICGTFQFGNDAAVTGTVVLNAGSGTHSVSVFDGATVNGNLGTTNVNLQSSQWSCSGSWTFGSNHTVNPGTSTVTITNTSTVTSNGKSFYNFVINAAARTITLSGALTIATGGTLTVTAFTAFAGNQYIIFAGSGSISIATAVSNRLRTAVAGSTITWTTGTNIWTIPAYTANDWGGDASADVAWRSSTPGTQYRILAPAGVVVSNMNPQDNLNSGTDINAMDGTSRDGGNNIGWLFPAGGSARISRSRIAISTGI